MFSLCSLYTNHEERSFVAWMRQTNQIYTGEEYHMRLGFFMTTQRFVQEHNKGDYSWKCGLNHLSALSPSEYRSLLGARPNLGREEGIALNTNNAPETMDYREKGQVNNVKDQGQCGSCWAFSAIQAQESAYAFKHGVLQSLSESNIVDCCTTCHGCGGGWPSKALDYVKKHQGGKFMLEDDYPYVAEQRSCKWDVTKGTSGFEKHVGVRKLSGKDLAEKMTTYGVASVCIDAGQSTFHSYSSGIYNDSKCSSLFLNHAVGCVGWGKEGSEEYWIIRNSWGVSWGESGYIRIHRGNNRCGVATDAIVVVTA